MTRRTKPSTKRSKPRSTPQASIAQNAGAGADDDRRRLSRQLEAAGSDATLASALVKEHPAIAGALGNATTHAQDAWLKRWAGSDELVKAAMRATVQEIEAKLTGPNPSQLERMLAGRVALCWLEANHFDRLAGLDQGGQSFEQAEFNLKRQDRAHRRYLSALKTFAEVRRLLIPAVQVNIGDKQVNVAGTVGPGLPPLPALPPPPFQPLAALEAPRPARETTGHEEADGTRNPRQFEEEGED